MEPFRVYRPVVASFHHFDEEQEPDMDPHQSDTDPQPCQEPYGGVRQEDHLCHLVRGEDSGVLLDLKDGVDVDTRLVRATRPVIPFYLHNINL